MIFLVKKWLIESLKNLKLVGAVEEDEVGDDAVNELELTIAYVDQFKVRACGLIDVDVDLIVGTGVVVREAKETQAWQAEVYIQLLDFWLISSVYPNILESLCVPERPKDVGADGEAEAKDDVVEVDTAQLLQRAHLG